MGNLKRILQNAKDQQLKGGGVVSKRLIDDLQSYRTQQLWIFIVIELLIVVGVALCAYYIAVHPENRAQAKTLTGLLGIGSGGGIEVIRRIWRNWSQTTLLLVLLPEATQAQVTEIIDRLLKKL